MQKYAKCELLFAETLALVSRFLDYLPFSSRIQLHALGGMVSLAASGATGVKGGNYKIFERELDIRGAPLSDPRAELRAELGDLFVVRCVQNSSDAAVRNSDWASMAT